MSREKKMQFYVNEREYQQLKELVLLRKHPVGCVVEVYAEYFNISMAEVLRDYIKSLNFKKQL